MLLETLAYPLLGLPLLFLGLRAWARFARGGGPLWLLAGLVACAVGCDALAALHVRLRYSTHFHDWIPWLWAGVAGCVGGLSWQLWRSLGRPASGGADPEKPCQYPGPRPN